MINIDFYKIFASIIRFELLRILFAFAIKYRLYIY